MPLLSDKLLLSDKQAKVISEMVERILSNHHQHVSHAVSTNSQLIQQVIDHAIEQKITLPTLLTADSQSAGRGQHGRQWQSPKGNLYFSFYHPLNASGFADDVDCLHLTAPLTGLLSLCVAHQLVKMPIIEQINQYRQKQNLPIIGVKWVNDIGFYQSLDDDFAIHGKQALQFYKLAGILIEPVQQAGKLLGVVIGIGINVQNAPNLTPAQQENMGHQAVGLSSLLDMLITPKQLYRPVLTACLTALSIHDRLRWHDGIDEFLNEFAKVDVLLNKRINIWSDHDDSVLAGQAMGIDHQGCLQIKDNDGKIQALFTGNMTGVFAGDDFI